MRCRVLGPVEVRGDQGWTRLRGQQAMLVAHLAAAFPQPVAFGVLQEAFWGSNPPAEPNAAMRVAVARLRKTLGDDLIEHTPSGYVLTVEPSSLDRTQFRGAATEALRAADRGNLEQALELAVDALGFWQGAAFASVSEQLTLAAAIRDLDDERRQLEELVVDLRLAAGQYEAAAAEASRNTDEVPLRERRWEQLMLGLHLGGRSVEALRIFQQYRRMLGDELGLEPGDSVRGLESAIVSGISTKGWLRFEQTSGPDEPGSNTVMAADPSFRLGSSSGPPTPSTTFIERPDELEALASTIDGANLITVVGAPGIGKTRLVLSWAAGLDKVEAVWVNLAVETDETVEDALKAAFGVSDLAGNGRSPLAERLDGRPCFLFIDNCEQVATTVGVLAPRLVESHPTLSIVAISQVPLAVQGERVFRVGAMSQEQSVRLLQARATTALSDADAALVVQGEDGVPLALELAAQRLASESAAIVASTIAANEALASVERLVNGDRRAFAALAPMRGSFELEAAAHLAERSESETRASLHRLVDASLLNAEPGALTTRFRLLEPLRQVAIDLAQRSGELQALQARHVGFYAASTVERAAGLHDAREERAVELLEADAAQVRAAWSQACEIHDVDRASMLASAWWWMTLRSLSHRDYSRPFETTLVPGFDDSAWKLDVLAASAMSEWARGRTMQSIEAGEAALAGEPQLDRPLPFDARFGLIASYSFRGRSEEAHEQLITLIREAREQQAWYYLSGAQAQIAIAFAAAGFPEQARPQADAASESAERSQNTSTLSFAHHVQGLVYAESDPRRALTEVYESIRLATRVGNRWHLGWTAATLTGLYRRVGRYPEAALKLDELLQHWRAVDMEPQFVGAVLDSALLFDAVGDSEGVRLALTIANEGRTHHPMLSSDLNAVAALRVTTPTPAPDRAEAELVSGLRQRLATITST